MTAPQFFLLARKYHVRSLAFIFLVLTLFGLSFASGMPHWFGYVALTLAFIPIGIQALKKLAQKKITTEFFLTIATVIGLLTHESVAITIVLLIMLIAHYLEHLIEDRTEDALKNLRALIPQKVILTTKGLHREISIDDVRPGMTLIVKTGAAIPVDGSVLEGTAEVNQSSLTGESIPVVKTIHDTVFAGTFIQSGSLIICVDKVGQETFFGKIHQLLKSAEESQAPTSLFTDKIALFLLPTLLLGSAITWLVTQNARLVVTLLVFGSPLELTVIPPLTILAGIIAAFRQGIVIKGGRALENFATLTTIVFDKTGTLTLGHPVVVAYRSVDPAYSDNNLLRIAAIAEKYSDHVIAKAVLEKAHQEGFDHLPDPEKYSSLSGHGVEIVFEGTPYLIGNRHFLQAPEHGNIKFSHNFDESSGNSTFYIGSQGRLLGFISVRDTLRDEARQTISLLKSRGMRQVILLSGDREEVAQATARDVAIDQVYSEVFPDQKVSVIRQLQEKNAVAMVGDGINDAPALKQATVGIAMGAMGSEPAIEAADIVLMTNDLTKIVFIYELSQEVMKVMKQNIFIGFIAVHLMGIILAFTGTLTPVSAALFHAICDLALLLNSVRLMQFKPSFKR